jgi:hypothetical protein
MLIEFSVTNYRSILGKQTLSLVAGVGNDHEQKNVIHCDGNQDRLLRSAAIYGPNAAGKSNLLKAISLLQWLIIHTASSQEGVQISGIVPFLLDKNSTHAPTELSIVFVADDGVKYEYFVSATSQLIYKEWLVAYPNNRPQRWFERELNPVSKKYDWWFGTKFKGDTAEKKVWNEFTRGNALFFSTAIQFNNAQLKPAFNWIANKLIVLASGVAIDPHLSIDLIKLNQEGKILDYLKAADIGIDGIRIQEDDQQAPNAQGSMRNPLTFSSRTNLSGGFNPPEGLGAILKSILTDHITNNDSSVHFSLEDESEGTKKLFHLTGGWIKSLEGGATLLVDELESSLHPFISKFLVGLFHSSKNINNAQLVFTTHDTNLLDTNLLRRDQIWFVEKNPNKATELYSLLEYKPRKDEVIERGYLKGRYGAIPFVREF